MGPLEYIRRCNRLCEERGLRPGLTAMLLLAGDARLLQVVEGGTDEQIARLNAAR